MKYMLLMYSKVGTLDITPEEQQALAQDWGKFINEATAAGALMSTNGFVDPANATTLRVRDGKRVVSDGPFAETHEALGGYALIDCQDLDEALHWAELIPTARYGGVEIRPLYMQ